MKGAAALLLQALCAAALAQGLPPPSRTVYKCEVDGKVQYSDAPCLGARKMEVEPTRGLNQSTGRPLVGQDVGRERQREAFAEGIRPLTGMNARQLDQAGRRQRLAPEVQRQCSLLDLQIPAAESAEKASRTAAELTAAQQRLFELRTAARKAGCD